MNQPFEAMIADMGYDNTPYGPIVRAVAERVWNDALKTAATKLSTAQQVGIQYKVTVDAVSIVAGLKLPVPYVRPV